MKNKKLLGLTVLGCGALLLTGCGSGTKLTCETTESGMTMKYILSYDNNKEKIEKVTTEATMDLGESEYGDLLDMDALKEEAEKQCDEQDTGDCRVTVDGKKLTISISGKAEDILDNDENKTYDEAKKYFENEGYTCK